MRSLPEGLPGALTLPKPERLTLADRWILTRLHDTIRSVSASFERFDFGVATETIWRFFWYEFCDWYLEATKERRQSRRRAPPCCRSCSNNAMRLLHPIAPFVTEEIVALASARRRDDHDRDLAGSARSPGRSRGRRALRHGEVHVERLRNERAENGLADRTRTASAFRAATARCANSAISSCISPTAMNAALRGTVRNAGGLLAARCAFEVDAARCARVRRERSRQRLLSEVERGEKKLANEAFIAKAAPDVVAKEREKLDGYRRRARARPTRSSPSLKGRE